MLSIPMAKQTLLYKDWLEDYELTKVQNNINRSWSMDNLPMDDNIWNF
jgi:hypothetical protein